MKAITFTLHTLEPVLVTQVESGEENSAVGLTYLPGSALRGALVARYLDRPRVDDLAAEPRSRTLFLDGTVCFLNAYPAVGGQRTLPRPLSWMAEKDRDEDAAAPLFDLAIEPHAPLEQPKAPKTGGYARLALPESERGRPEVVLASPRQQGDVHIALNAPNVRTDENAVYRYDAIAAGETFAGAIVAPLEADLDPILALLALGDELFVGGAHSAGYGRVRVEEVTPVDPWQEVEPSDGESGGLVVVTLLSDAIVRGPGGQIDADLDGALARLLGVDRLAPLRSYRRTRIVGGYNRKWGLPVPQAWALAAGSVFVYDADQVDAGELRERTACGIGERRAEGFGRLAVNWQVWPEIAQQAAPRIDRLPVRLSEASQQLARRMAKRRLALALERGLVAHIATARIGRAPQNAQLSRVRNAAQRALHTKSLASLHEHLQGLRARRPIWQQFEDARVNGERMSEWIEARVQEQDVTTTLLRGARFPRVAGIEAELTPDLKAIYTARLIDGVMNKAIRQRQGAANPDQEEGE